MPSFTNQNESNNVTIQAAFSPAFSLETFSVFYETYDNDEAAIQAETDLVKNVGLWEDPDFYGADALYKDETMPPTGEFPKKYLLVA